MTTRSVVRLALLFSILVTAFLGSVAPAGATPAPPPPTYSQSQCVFAQQKCIKLNVAKDVSANGVSGWVPANSSAAALVFNLSPSPATFYYRIHVSSAGSDIAPGIESVYDAACGGYLSTTPAPGSDANSNGDIDPSETWTYYCSHAFDMGAGDGNPFDNLAIVTAKFVGSYNNGIVVLRAQDKDHAWSRVIDPLIKLDKHGPTDAHVGDTVTYYFDVFNPPHLNPAYDGPLHNVHVDDNLCPFGNMSLPIEFNIPNNPGAGFHGAPAALQPGKEWRYSCTFVLLGPLPNLITNSALATGTPSVGDDTTSTDAWDTKIHHPSFTLKKTAPEWVKAGDTIHWTLTVANTGNSELDVYIQDDCVRSAPDQNPVHLTVGQWRAIDCTSIASTSGDPRAENEACASAKDELGGPNGWVKATPNCASASTTIVKPKLSVKKTVDLKGAVAGQVLHYHVVITNTGTAIMDVLWEDLGCENFSTAQQVVLLGPGGQFTFDCTHTYDGTGPYQNEACAHGWVVDDTNTTPITLRNELTSDAHDCDHATTKLSTVSIVKSSPQTVAHEGAPVHFDYQVTNTGAAPLSSVVVGDDKCGAVHGPYTSKVTDTANLPPAPANPATLGQNETWWYYCEYTLGSHLGDTVTNVATVTASPGAAQTVTAQDTYDMRILHASFTVKKQGPLYVKAGDGFKWKLIFTNTGNGPVTITPTDALCHIEYSALPTFVLDVGERRELKCYAHAPDNGTVLMHNEVCATGADELYKGPKAADQSGFIHETCGEAWTTVVHPRLAVTKTVDITGAPSGDLLTYHITVKNTGDTDLLVTPIDIGNYDEYLTVTPGCENPTDPTTHEPLPQTQWTMGPGTSFAYDCTHLYDPPEGASDATYTNQVCAYGKVRVDFSPSEPLTFPVATGLTSLTFGNENVPQHDVSKCAEASTKHAEVHLLKNGYEGNNPPSVGTDEGDNGPQHFVHEGDTVTYDYAVSNPGKAPLKNVTMFDIPCSQADAASPNNPSKFTGPTQNDFAPDLVTLQPGKEWEYTCSQVLPAKGDPRRALINAGDGVNDTFTNDAKVEAWPVNGGSKVVEDAEHTVTFITPSLSVVKTGPAVAVAGEGIRYTITVNNTGDTALYDITLTDPKCIFDSGEDPKGFSLPRGGSETFHCEVTLPEGPSDIAKASYENQACATGYDILAIAPLAPDNDVTKGTATGCSLVVKTDLVHPTLKINKTVDKTAANPGDQLTYTIEVVNTGDAEVWVASWDPGCESTLNQWDTHFELQKAGDKTLDGKPADRKSYTCTATFNPSEGAVTQVNKACAAAWLADGLADPRPENVGQYFINGGDKADAYTCGEVTTWKLGKLEITKDKVGGAYAHEGDSATFTYQVHNTGEVALDQIKVTDSLCGSESAPITGPKENGENVPDGTKLEPDHTWTYSCTYTLGAHPDSKNEIVNKAWASGVGPGDGHVLTDPPAEFTTTTIHPALIIKKKGPIIAVAGEEIHYSIYVKNTGDTRLKVTLADQGCIGLPDGKFYLDPLADDTYYCTVMPLSDPGLPTDPDVTNKACATGVDMLGGDKGTVEKCDTVVTKMTHPQLTVTKTVDEATADYPDVLHYHVTVANTGDIEMRVQAWDDKCDEESIQGDTYKHSLDKGTSITFTCTHTFTVADGTSYTNEACANGWVDVNDGPDQTYPLGATGNAEHLDAKACGSATTKLAQHTVSGKTFVDVSANGLHDPGEPPLPGVLVYADLNNDGIHQPSEPSAVSDANGDYTVPVKLGTTVIRAQAPDGSTCSAPASCSYTVNMQNGAPLVITRPLHARATDATGVDFGSWKPGSVTGGVFKDDNHNGVRDGGEGPIFNATVYADVNNNRTLDVTEPASTTSALGAYTIGGLKPGSYLIRQVAISGNDCTAPAGCSYSATVSSGSLVGSLDFLNGPQAVQAVLGARQSAGTAKLSGQTGCVNKAFRVRVRGTSIASVMFSLDGYLIGRGSSARGSANDYFVRVDPARLKLGTHRVVAEVTFTHASGTGNKKLKLTFMRCGSQLKAPAFTGGKKHH